MRSNIVRTIGRRIRSGLQASLPLAIIWGLFATVFYSCADDPHPERHESLPSLLTLYFSVAIVCGAVYGLLKDWAKTDLRFGIMCSAIGFLWSLALMLMVNDWDFTQVSQFDGYVFGFFGVALGPPIGFYLRSRWGSRPSMPNDGWCCWPASEAAAGPPLRFHGKLAAAPPPHLFERPQHNRTLGRHLTRYRPYCIA